MKTAKEWFEQQPEPLRTVLLNALEICPERGHLPYPNLRDAVIWAFDYHPDRDQFKFLAWGIRQAIDWGVSIANDNYVYAGVEIYQASQQPRPIGSVLWYELTKDGKPQWVWKVKGKQVEPLPIPDALPTQVAYISVSPDEYGQLKLENEQLRKETAMNNAMSEFLLAAGINTLEQLQSMIDLVAALKKDGIHCVEHYRETVRDLVAKNVLGHWAETSNGVIFVDHLRLIARKAELYDRHIDGVGGLVGMNEAHKVATENILRELAMEERKK